MEVITKIKQRYRFLEHPVYPWLLNAAACFIINSQKYDTR